MTIPLGTDLRWDMRVIIDKMLLLGRRTQDILKRDATASEIPHLPFLLKT